MKPLKIAGIALGLLLFAYIIYAGVKTGEWFGLIVIVAAFGIAVYAYSH